MPPPTPVLCVVGTRPEAIKSLPVVRALRARGVGCHLQLTGQHPSLAQEVLDVLRIPADGTCSPAWPVDVLAPPDHHPASPDAAERPVAAIRDALLPVLAAVRPRIVLVHGDTTSALAGALAAAALDIPIGHIEAGLRSHDLWAPFPEELFRRRIDGLATWHFAPTATARDNLLAEGLPGTSIHVTGNTGIDALHDVLARLDAPPPQRPAHRRMLLVTAHRRENLGPPLARVVGALAHLADTYPALDLVLPVHPNPAVATLLEPLAGQPNVHLAPPLSYPDFVALLRRSFAVLTDSGGVQEEAPVLGKPLLVLRERTERPEGVEAGTARLVGTDPERIIAEVERLLTDPTHHAAMSRVHSPYGDGHAAERIAGIIEIALRHLTR